MRYVELVPGVKSSVLGFGCSTLRGAAGGPTPQAAVSAALDVGINHFDVARSYELGGAEKLLGQLVRSRRSAVTVVTKFGLQPRPWAHLLQPLKPLVRSLRGARRPAESDGGGAPPPAGAASFDRWAAWQYRRLAMTGAAMRSSLEASLRAMRTDYIDVLLMHEPPVIERWDELLGCAAELKRAGKIRGWGLATQTLAPEYLRHELDVLQTSAAQPDLARAQSERTSLHSGLVLFSALRGIAPGGAAARLSALWSEFPGAVVVCTMRSPVHIRNNAATAGRRELNHR